MAGRWREDGGQMAGRWRADVLDFALAILAFLSLSFY